MATIAKLLKLSLEEMPLPTQYAMSYKSNKYVKKAAYRNNES